MATPIMNDGNFPYQGVVVTISGTTYIADDFTVNRPTKTLENRDQNDEPNGQVTYADFITGSATLQLATTTTAIPQQGATFSVTLDSSIGAETFYISDRDDARKVGEIRKQPIKFRKKINP